MVQWIVQSDLMFMETSAMTGEGVEEVFHKCTKSIVNKIDQGLFSECARGACFRPSHSGKYSNVQYWHILTVIDCRSD